MGNIKQLGLLSLLVLAACGGDGNGPAVINAGGPGDRTAVAPTRGDGASGAAAGASSTSSPEAASAPPAPAPSATPSAAAGTTVQVDGQDCYTLLPDFAASAGGSSTVSLYPAPGTAYVSHYRVLGNPASAGMCLANYRRALVGLPALATRAPLATAAQNHSNYMLWSGTPSHDEIAGKTGYTSATPNDRIQALYPTRMTGEVLAFSGISTSQARAPLALSSNDALVAQLIDAPFHRMGLLGNFQSAGSGYASKVESTSSGGTTASFYQVIDMADELTIGTDTQLLAYPYAGQSGVPASWADYESPDPAPGYQGKTLGYPISLQGLKTGATLDVTSFALVDAANANVPCLLAASSTASLPQQTRAELQSSAICTPLAPLKAATRYTVSVKGRYGSNPFELSWSFST
ncbi:MAG: CAP domain-containing protein [Burkholderia sp.]